MHRYEFFDEGAWLKAWNEGVPSAATSGLFSWRRSPETEAFQAAAHFVGGACLSKGFRLFRNGGLPLLERRVGPLLEEIVIEPGPRSAKSVYAPLAVKVHVSHEGLRNIRERYWRVASRAPISVASGHLGLVDEPPAWVLWDVAQGGRVLEDLAMWVHRLALPWFARFENLDDLDQAVLHREVRLLRAADALELILAERGRTAAKQFLRDIIEFGGTVSRNPEPLRRVDEEAPLRARLDAIATCFRLR